MGQYAATTAVFKNAVFAGGGSRCFWQIGFWDGAIQAGLALNDTVDYVASSSAGCAFATAALLNRGPESLALFKQMTARNPRNIYWQNLKPGAAEPVLPHFKMYRQGLEQLLSHRDLDLLANKRLEFLMAKRPRYLRGGFGTTAAFTVYGLEKRLTGKIHPSWTRKLGFKPLVGSNQDAESLQDFINMILASSCVPPILPSVDHRGEAVLDGGFIDNAPAFLADGRSGMTLVLLSKRFRRPLPKAADRVYVQPSEPIRIDKFDYTNPEGLQEAYDLGVKDGRRFGEAAQLSGARVQ
jgi:predicted acylesterase/phospholipase RssA